MASLCQNMRSPSSMNYEVNANISRSVTLAMREEKVLEVEFFDNLLGKNYRNQVDS